MIDQGLTGAIVGHFIGDFLLQNDWMAQNKKKRTWPCVVHVSLYTAAVMFFSGWWLLPNAWVVAVVVLWPHFAIDRSQFVAWFMRMMGQDGFAKPPMAPWSMIAVDNAMHFVCLWVVAAALGGAI